MRSKLGLGLVTAGMIAFAGSAQAVVQDYSGLAFNSTIPLLYHYSAISDSVLGLVTGPNLDQAGSVAAGLGQSNYTVTVPGAIADDGSMAPGSIDFGASTKVMTFGGGATTMSIVDGHLGIKDNDGSVGCFLIFCSPGQNTGDPVVTLPFGLGTADPDYELTDGYLNVMLNGEAWRFDLCGDANIFNSCYFDGDDRPWSDYDAGLLAQPYNTLNVGNLANDLSDGTTDLSMFLYLRGERVQGAGVAGQNFNFCQNSFDFGCDEPDYKYMKLALWGAAEQDTPEPATLSLFGLGLIGLGAAARRRRQAA